MTLTVADRVNRIRQGIKEAKADPWDLFGIRMMIHESFSNLGVDTNQVAGLLLPDRAPIEVKHLDMLDQIAIMFELYPEDAERNPMGLCEVVKILLG